MRDILFIIFIVFIFSGNTYSAQKIWSTNFNNPTTMTDYPINITDYNESLEHMAATEMVTSYNANEMGQTWTPHSGSHFWMQNDSNNYALNPSVPGITQGTVNAHNTVLYDTTYCGTDQGGSCVDFNLNGEATTGEFFISFYARFNQGFETIEDGGRMKWIRFASQNGYYPTDDMIYMHLQTRDISPTMYFACTAEGGWIPTDGGPELVNAYDGNWHKFSMYVNYNTGVILGWYDEDNETVGNAIKSYTAPDGELGDGPATSAQYITIQANFSAKQPTEETYHALDDIEIWDGIPTSAAADNETSFNPDYQTSFGAQGTTIFAFTIDNIIDNLTPERRPIRVTAFIIILIVCFEIRRRNVKTNNYIRSK